MLNFSSDASICYFSIWALCNICAGGGGGVCVYVNENGAAEIAQDAVVRFSADDGIVGKSSELLRLLSEGVEGGGEGGAGGLKRRTGENFDQALL